MVWHLGWQLWKVSLLGLKGNLARAEVLKVLWSSVKGAMPSWGSVLQPLQVSLCQRRAGWDADLGQMGTGAGLVDDDHVDVAGEGSGSLQDATPPRLGLGDALPEMGDPKYVGEGYSQSLSGGLQPVADTQVETQP